MLLYKDETRKLKNGGVRTITISTQSSPLVTFEWQLINSRWADLLINGSLGSLNYAEQALISAILAIGFNGATTPGEVELFLLHHKVNRAVP